MSTTQTAAATPTARTFRVYVSSGRFFSIFDAGAASETEAQRLVTEAANDPRALRDESIAAQMIGETAGGPYSVYRCEPSSRDLADGEVRLVNSGGEG